MKMILKHYIHSLGMRVEQLWFLLFELVKQRVGGSGRQIVRQTVWRVGAQLVMIAALRILFYPFFGAMIPHFTLYIFSGVMVFTFFAECSCEGMDTVIRDREMLRQVNAPRSAFLLAGSVQACADLGCMTCIFLVLCVIAHVGLGWKLLLLLFPFVCLAAFSLGVGYILAMAAAFSGAAKRIWMFVLQLLFYASAVFYSSGVWNGIMRIVLMSNPLYLFNRYVRKVVLEGGVPRTGLHLLMLAQTAAVVWLCCWMRKRLSAAFRRQGEEA